MGARDEIACSLTELFDELGESIVLDGADFRCEVNALVTLDSAGIVEDEIPDLEGTLRLRVKDVPELKLDSEPVLTATIRDQRCHLFGPPSIESGMLTLNFRRHRSEEPYSNITDLNDDQQRLQ